MYLERYTFSSRPDRNISTGYGNDRLLLLFLDRSKEEEDMTGHGRLSRPDRLPARAIVS